MSTYSISSPCGAAVSPEENSDNLYVQEPHPQGSELEMYRVPSSAQNFYDYYCMAKINPERLYAFEVACYLGQRDIVSYAEWKVFHRLTQFDGLLDESEAFDAVLYRA